MLTRIQATLDEIASDYSGTVECLGGNVFAAVIPLRDISGRLAAEVYFSIEDGYNGGGPTPYVVTYCDDPHGENRDHDHFTGDEPYVGLDYQQARSCIRRLARGHLPL